MKKIIFLFSFLIFFSCTYNELVPGCTDPLAINYNQNAVINDGSCILDDCSSSQPSFVDCIKPIIDNHCVQCHSEGSSYGDLSTYESLRDFTVDRDLIIRISTNENDPLFMPYGNPKLSQIEIDILSKWKDNGAPNN
tara:strand:- start:15672 stop:16082 length:411 start_codon:yes stop_codon:yes gene_type:complete